MKKIVYTAALLLTAFTAPAQVISNGIVKYEKRTSLKLQMKNTFSDKPDMLRYIDQVPNTVSSYFTLYFTPRQSLYKFEEHEKLQGMASYFSGSSPANENVVHRNLKSDTITAKKKFYDAEFILKEVPKAHQWKIEEEIREIAGYPCRKAVTTMFDSVVVVAFYTESILPCSGPESISGLPGMILGVAIPRLYTTWFATEVQLKEPPPEVFAYNFKGKVTGSEDMEALVKKSTKGWGGSWSVYSTWWMKL